MEHLDVFGLIHRSRSPRPERAFLDAGLPGQPAAERVLRVWGPSAQSSL